MATSLRTTKWLLLLVTVLLIAGAQAQVTTLWQKSNATTNIPTWFSTSANSERGIAYGTFGGQPRLFVASTNGGNKIIMLNPATGDSIGALNTTTVTGGTLALSDVEVSEGGFVYAANIVATSAAATPLKIYRWANAVDTPTVIATYELGGYRLGDKFTVVGAESNNSIKLIFPRSSGANIIVFSTTNNGASFTAADVPFTGQTVGATASFAPTETGGGYLKSNGQSLRYFKPDNTLGGTVDPNIILGTSNAVRWFTANSRKFLAVFNYGNSTSATTTNAFMERGIIYEISGSDTSGGVVGATPVLGTNSNTNGTGDVVVVKNLDNTFNVFVLSTNNGLGAYKFDPAAAAFVVTPPATQDFGQFFPPANWTRYINISVSPQSITTSGWVVDDYTNVAAPYNRSAKINVYGTGRYYSLVSPGYALVGTNTYQLEYDLALTTWNAVTADTLGPDDTLLVVMSTDNGATWNWGSPLKRYTESTMISPTGQHEVISVPAGTSGTVKFLFYAGSVTANQDNDLFLDNVQVRIIPTQPAFTVTPASKDFGGVQFGTQSQPQLFTVTNTGVGTLTVNAPAITGANASSFVKADTNTYPKSLTANQSLTFSVTFAPADTGAKAASIAITHNAAGSPASVALNGRGIDYTVRSFPWFEGFEAGLVPPAGWANPGNWWNRGTESKSGAFCARIAYNFSTTQQAYLVSPAINLPAKSKITFWWKDDDITLGSALNEGEERVMGPTIIGHDTTFFEISTDGGTTWRTLDTLAAPSAMTAYVQVVRDLTPYAGTGRLLRWRDKTDGLTAAYGTGVDDIMIEEILPFTPLWQRSVAGNNLPVWFSTGNFERNLAYGVVNGNPRLYVSSRNGGTFIRILNATTGADVDTLPTFGMNGGTFVVSDVETSTDGKIFACNLTLNLSTSAFKVYQWNSETSLPVNIINYTGADAARLGDKMTVTGSVADNSAVIWAVSPTASFAKVYKWTMSGGSFNANPVIVPLNDGVIGSAAGVGPLPDGAFYWKGNGAQARKYNASGILIDTISGTVVASGSNGPKYISAVGGKEYFALYQYGAGNENARVVGLIPTNFGSAATYGVTATLGPNANTNGTGDVAIKTNPDGTADIWVVATNNGVGAYRTTAVVPVELTSFTASVSGSSVVLTWATATETNNQGYAVERKSGSGAYEAIGWIDGKGTSTSVNRYTFRDERLVPGTYSYRLKQVDFNGAYTYYHAAEVEIVMPEVFALGQNYPNPFNPATSIRFTVPVDGNVSLAVYNVIGQKVATLVNGFVKAGTYDASFDASQLPSGIYLYKMEAGKFSQTRKMMLVK